MKKLVQIALAATIALSLGGCFNPFQTVDISTADTDLYAAELVFDGAVKTFNQLKDLCGKRALPPACRTYVKQGQGLIQKSYAADLSARQFIKDNPTLSAVSAIQAFQGLVTSFQTNNTTLGNLRT